MATCKQNEYERLRALASFALLDTPQEERFDEITRLASMLLGAESAAISLIDDKRQWFKSRVGIAFSETPREQAFCDYAVTSQSFIEVGDASADPRFVANPLVARERGIRFYAGAPLIVSTGHCLGTLCVFDPTSRGPLSADQRRALVVLARLVVERIEGIRDRKLSEIATRMVDATSDAILCVDASGRISYWNRAAEKIFGYAADEAIGQAIGLIITKNGRSSANYRSMLRSFTGRRGHSETVFELEAERKAGERFPIELSVARLEEDRPTRRLGYAAIIRDVTTRKQRERENAQTRLFLDTIIANLPAMLFVKDSGTRRYELLNRTGEEFIGLPASAVVGRTDRELFPDTGEGYHERDSHVLSSGGVQFYESDFTRQDGRVIRLRTKRIMVDGPDMPGQFILGMSEDVTDIREAQEQILRLAQHDSLTNLHNRASFLERVDTLTRSETPFAVLTIDLDRFKAINDQFGHVAGDEVLTQVAERLCSVVGSEAFAARVGGDEFTVLIAGSDPVRDAHRLAAALVRRLGEPYRLERFVAHTGASIGVVICPDDGANLSQLRQAADLAMYRAKAGGGSSACFYSPEMDKAARDRCVLEVDLRRAVEQGGISVLYQPVVSTATGLTTSFEALARWIHPQRGPIPPDLFISIAEECGLVPELGRQVLETACREAASWPSHIRVAVNLSPLQFESGDLAATIVEVLARTGLPATRLQLEVTEGLVIRNVDRVFEILQALRDLGIQILMDDFGVGYSSLGYFERFPFDKVKIDRSFVSRMLESPVSYAIIEAVIGLGKRLGMGTVAEGVETAEQMNALVQLGCTHLQGYLISRPRPAADFEHILRAVPQTGQADARGAGSPSL
ncbi:diguanylate cyclase (GGDEF)-like protein/PAS domain S-box-containing protein [Sphingomonas kyeonggiensis]|uniref:Diguanylate cyclase (GGDEF)-like protein/PAS domain S-box-containing protein n=1 Tax=Sphingomonas kyeonggiensis TaxID=1268553 RepID=A0A7W7K573_9SPHN|nr:EAL domain-containing protein [Sphingomonas kyeonggiensis]MBB4841282.1 diguanylate cyclase (GGDEF)-like protein/PAS domain S-box-containing protein [Sphingomonas kyeonggiensis]